MLTTTRALAMGCFSLLLGFGCGTDAASGSDTPAAGADVNATDAVAEDTSGDAAAGDVTADSTNADDASAIDVGGPLPTALGGVRPAPYYVPEGYDAAVPMPVLVLLHGYTGSGVFTAQWWQMRAAADQAGVLLVVPEGTVDPGGEPFWNGTDFCCDFYGSGVDDVGYITGLIDEANTWFNIDPTKVWLIGHSNGGFMSHRIACERSDLVTAIVNVAGATYSDPTDCGEPVPVSVLQVHGTWDTTIFSGGIEPIIGDPDASPVRFADCMGEVCRREWNACLADESCDEMLTCFGACDADEACNSECVEAGTREAFFLWMEALTCGASGGCFADQRQTRAGYPSAQEGAERWAEINGCSSTATDGPEFDLIEELPNDDTFPRSFDDCPAGLSADLWSIRYGSHGPGFNDSFAPAVLEWLAAQSRP
jgi:poly(3-hydroxybutyrate) depolymerase